MTEADRDAMEEAPTDGDGGGQTFFVCPVCDTRYEEDLRTCPADGAELVRHPPLRSRDLVGETIADRYEIQEEIAVGGMGIVYKARQKLVGRDVAIKILPRELAADGDTERRFFNEARAISQLRHPNIVTLFDFGRTAARDLFIVMEYVKGEPLSAHLEGGPMPLESVVQVGEQICSALEEAHRVGIVHRDIKPDNVMLELRGGRLHVRLLDFGIAKSDLDTARQSQTGTVFGTPEYISPEQVLGRMVDARADVYGVGLILFEMLCGARPFEGSGPAVAYRHAHDPVPMLTERYPEMAIPAQLSQLVRTIMSKNPLDRPSSASAVRRRLQEATMLPVYEPEQSTRPMPLHLESSMPPPVLTSPLPRARLSSGPHSVAPAPIPSGDSLAPLPRPWEEADPRGRTYDPAVHASVEHSTRNRSTLDRPGPEVDPHGRRTLLLALLLLCVIVLALVYTVEETTYRRYRGTGQPISPAPSIVVTPTEPALITRRAYDGIFGVIAQAPLPDVAVYTPEQQLLAPPVELLEPTARTLPAKPALTGAIRRVRSIQMPSDPAARRPLFARRAVLEWAMANAQHQDELARYAEEATAFLNSDQGEPPTRPLPIYGNAVAALEWLITHESKPESADVVSFYLARGLSSVGRREDALGRLRHLVDSYPQSPYALRARWPLSQVALHARDWVQARRHLEPLAQIEDPKTQRAARFSLAYVAYAQGRYDEAIDHLHQVVESLDDGPSRATFWAPSLEVLTLSYARLDGGQRLARSYFRGLGGMGLVMRQSRLLGFALGVSGQGLDALRVYESYRSSASDQGGRGYARAMQAYNQVQLGNHVVAESFFSQSERCRGGLPPSAQRPCLYALGVARAARGQLDDARAAWAQVDSIPGTADDVEALHWQGAARLALAESLAEEFFARAPNEMTAADRVRVEKAYMRVTTMGLARWVVPAHYGLAALHRRTDGIGEAPARESAGRAHAARTAAETAAQKVGLQPRWRTPPATTVETP